MSSPTPSSHRYFYLKVAPDSSTGNANRYVRYTGSGHSDIVLTEEHPKFLKFYLKDGRQLASHNDRKFGFVMSRRSPGPLEIPRTVEMFEDQGNTGFYFDEQDGAKLKWQSHREETDGNAEDWGRWVLRETPPEVYKGNPQLFWVSANHEKDLPRGVEIVDLVAEYL